MITYNHAKFISQAIESVLFQETTFPVELVIGEDRSTDGTREIVEDYSRKYPNVIRALLHVKNLGALNNNVTTLSQCQGTYVAMLEGDDYWTKVDKLQKQVEFLDVNSECVMCFHDAEVVECDELTKTPFFVKCPPNRLGFNDFAGGFYPHTASCIFVNDRSALEPVFFGYVLGYALAIFECLLAGGLQAGFIPDKMSIYRIHSGGIFSAIGREQQLMMNNHSMLASWRWFKRGNLGTNFAVRLIDNYLSLTTLHWSERRVLLCFLAYWKAWVVLCSPPTLLGFRRFGTRHMHFIRNFFLRTR
jgi:glycosyltransferase involved in cell wall biosynthesis